MSLAPWLSKRVAALMKTGLLLLAACASSATAQWDGASSSSTTYSCRQIRAAYQKKVDGVTCCSDNVEHFNTPDRAIVDTRVVSWVDAEEKMNDVLGSFLAEYPAELTSRGVPRGNFVGNFDDNWEVRFPLLSDQRRSALQSACNAGHNLCTPSKQHATFAYSIFDQTQTFSGCSSMDPETKSHIFDQTIGFLNTLYTGLYPLSVYPNIGTQIDTNALRNQYRKECFDLDVAGVPIDTTSTKFSEVHTLGYRIRIHDGKTCDTELPHISVYGKTEAALATETQPATQPTTTRAWNALTQTSYDAGNIALGSGTYDFFVNQNDMWEGGNGAQVLGSASHEKNGGIKPEDSVVRITLVTQSDHVLESSDACAFTIEKIYLNDVVYDLKPDKEI